jgi:hypothetical protein
MPHFQARQGDVLIERISRLPTQLTSCPRERGRLVLAHGEVTFHTHAIADPDVELLARPGETVGDVAERWLRVGRGGATVVHDEHAAIGLAPGIYRVTRQREFTDADEPILVAD